MLITFKTLQQKTFKIEIDESSTVLQLKEKIAEEQSAGEFPIDTQKLIYSGKILEDAKTIAEYNIDPVKNFVVVMAIKPKVTAPAAASLPAVVTETTSSAAAAAPVASSASESSTAATTATTTTPAATGIQTADSQLLTGTALESSITELMSLGFDRDQVMRALQASFNNADRAAEYLFSGNIPNLPGDDDVADVPAEAGDGVAAPSGGEMPTSLAFLRSLPQFQQMRQRLQTNPAALPQLLQEIGAANPQLLTLISQNQEAFISLLNEPAGDVVGDDAMGGEGVAGGMGGGMGGGMQVQVTQEEKAIIDRIVSMGFEEGEVIQAFFACDKNESLTVNFLLG